MCAARGNNVRVVEYLAEAVESLNGDATDCTGATALHHAASAGHPSMITALSNVPRIELNATDKVRVVSFLKKKLKPGITDAALKSFSMEGTDLFEGTLLDE